MWLILAFLSAALLGFYDVFKKQSLKDNAVLPVLFLNTIFCSLIFMPFILVSRMAPWLLEKTVCYLPEVEWRVHGFILLKSFSGSLLFGFFCDVDGDDTLTVDHEELSMAQWVERDKIPDQGNNISLTKEMMMLFRDGKEPR